MNGHPIDKIEILILGGTWASYPHQYQEEFIRDLFYAANTFWQRPPREQRYSLLQEQVANETAVCKIIGLTLETRPDCINQDEIRRFRRYGCTRIQLGVQHTDDSVLTLVNRGCTTRDAEQAIEMLKNCCYKMDIHLMPNLPGTSKEIDITMFNHVLESPNLQVDQWKIYPCEVTPWTLIKQWHSQGTYVPYSDADLIEVLKHAMPKIHPWIRVNRVVRDIPSQYILAGLNQPNLRQDLDKFFESQGIALKDIRAREVKAETESVVSEGVEVVIRQYGASNGQEYFISVESRDRSTICGFTRLRLGNPETQIFPELDGCALIRELHVYGQLVATTDKENAHAQHTGFGSTLMQTAEHFALNNGYHRMAVIAGVGVRNYYRKLGYILEGEGQFMIKNLEPSNLPSPFPWHSCNQETLEGGLETCEWVLETSNILTKKSRAQQTNPQE